MSIWDKNEYCSETFESEDLSGVEISSKQFEACKFIGCNFSEATFNRCSFVECEFTKCNLSVVNIEYSKFSDVVFRGSKVIGIDWAKGVWPRLLFNSPIKFYDSILNDSSFHGLSLPDLVLQSCIAHRVDFRDADFTSSNFTGTDFSSSMFEKTTLSKVDFTNATDFDIDIFSNNLKKAKFDRFEAIRLLGCLDIELV
ncbi:pentapeptide repeat-containing protein [Neptuniibacter sp. SY11_33]|uniref:pentapeptide repeat-containing protein n=1 Tax=Neptuniibacter sp. SY11_33 TaxID=3398215 RepID=UPI0039F57DDC